MKNILYIIILIITLFIISAEIDRRRYNSIWDFNHYYSTPLPLMGLYNNIIAFSHPSHTHVFKSDEFENDSYLRKNWKVFQEEATNLYKKKNKLINMSQLSKTSFNGIDKEKDQWKVFVIKWYDKSLDNSKKLCPKTTAIIENCPNIHAAMFSILEPGKFIPPHKGPFKGCLRYHLGLKIPKDRKNCYIKVNDEKFYWEEGKSLVFDDTYEHSVYNNTNEHRIILFIDIERPLMYPLNDINSYLTNNGALANFVKEVNNNAEQVKELFHV